MIASIKHNFVFVKTKKTAGSTLEALLYPHLGPKDLCTGSERDGTPRKNVSNAERKKMHAEWSQCRKMCNVPFGKEFYNEAYSFAIERNPWDKMVSAYFWYKEIKPNVAGNSFEQYVMKGSMHPNCWSKIWKSQKKELGVSHVYKYEEMWGMYKDLNNRFGFGITKEQVEGTKLKSEFREVSDYREMYTPKLIEEVRKRFKPMIEYMEYEYDG